MRDDMAMGSILAVLMDIRDELQKLNRVFNCGNFLSLPHVVQGIEKNTRKRKYVRRPKEGQS